MSTATDMITAIETALASNAGVVSITVDGESVRYDRMQALKELEYWKKEASKESGTRPTFAGIKLNF